MSKKRFERMKTKKMSSVPQFYKTFNEAIKMDKLNNIWVSIEYINKHPESVEWFVFNYLLKCENNTFSIRNNIIEKINKRTVLFCHKNIFNKIDKIDNRSLSNFYTKYRNLSLAMLLYKNKLASLLGPSFSKYTCNEIFEYLRPVTFEITKFDNMNTLLINFVNEEYKPIILKSRSVCINLLSIFCQKVELIKWKSNFKYVLYAVLLPILISIVAVVFSILQYFKN